MEKTYTMRSLNANDLFAMMRIINKIGINEVKKMFSPLFFPAVNSLNFS